MQDQTAYLEDGPDLEPEDDKAFELNLKKSANIPLDSTRKRKKERQKKDDEELLILRSLAAFVEEEDDCQTAATKLQALQLHLGIMFHKLYLSWINVQD